MKKVYWYFPLPSPFILKKKLIKAFWAYCVICVPNVVTLGKFSTSMCIQTTATIVSMRNSSSGHQTSSA